MSGTHPVLQFNLPGRCIDQNIVVVPQSTPSEQVTPGGQSNKSLKLDTGSQPKKSTPQKAEKVRDPGTGRASGQPPTVDPAHANSATQVLKYMYHYIDKC